MHGAGCIHFHTNLCTVIQGHIVDLCSLWPTRKIPCPQVTITSTTEELPSLIIIDMYRQQQHMDI